MKSLIYLSRPYPGAPYPDSPGETRPTPEFLLPDLNYEVFIMAWPAAERLLD